MSSGDTVADPVHLRFLLVRELPLLVAAVADRGRGAQLLTALAERDLPTIEGFLGVPLPRGAKVGFSIDAEQLRLVDEQDAALVRVERDALDADWLAAARRMRGTMFVVLRDEVLDAEEEPAHLATRIDGCARSGSARGAIVGVVEERPTLPLIF